jgi:hypothetical protein
VGAEPEKRLDEAKIEILRIWGEGLSGDPRDEVKAAGKAITLLVEEIERLNVDLWNERAQIRFAEPSASAERETSLQHALVPRFGSSSA